MDCQELNKKELEKEQIKKSKVTLIIKEDGSIIDMVSLTLDKCIRVAAALISNDKANGDDSFSYMLLNNGMLIDMKELLRNM